MSGGGSRTKPTRHIMVRLYEHVEEHRRVLKWIDGLPKDTGGRPRLSEHLVRLILADLEDAPPADAQVPTPSASLAQNGDADLGAPTPNLKGLESGGEGGLLEGRAPSGNTVSSLVASLKHQLDMEDT